MANGMLPRSFYSAIATSILIPIAKDSSANPDVRPIALGDTLSKVVGKLLLKISKDAIARIFQPFQLGIGFSNATEVIAHSIEALRIKNPTWDILALDFKNAFNSVSRKAALEQCLLRMPSLFPYLNAMYGEESKLLVRRSDGKISTIASKEGARQGDALGPLFYCLGSLPLLNSIINGCESSHVFGYIDDIHIIGPSNEIAKAISITISEGKKYGLNLNLNKCSILSASSVKDLKTYGEFIDASRIKIKSISYDDDVDYGITCLGTPIGSTGYITNWLKNKISELKLDSQLIMSVTDKQCKWLLLFYVLRNKLTFFLRNVNPIFVNYILEDIKQIFSDVLQDIVGNHVILQDEHLYLASLPFSAGGCALNFYFLECTSVCAYLASTCTAFKFLSEENILDKNDDWFKDRIVVNLSKHSTFSGKDIQYDILCEKYDKFNVLKLQKHLSDEIVVYLIKHFEATFSKDKSFIARYQNTNTDSSTKFLLGIPRISQTTFNNDEFSKAICSKLLLPVTSSSITLTCNCKKNQIVDLYGEHILTCSFRNEWKNRHDNLCRALLELFKDAGLHARLDSNSNRIHRENGDKLFTDLTILNSPLHGGNTVRFDVSITHCKAIDVSDSSISQREKAKVKKYKDACSFSGRNNEFMPLVFTTQGAFSNTTSNLISKLCFEVANRTSRPYSVVKHNWLVKLSCVLQKSNASMIINKLDNLCSQQMRYTSVSAAHISYTSNLVILE
jgi:hypothetical protein